MRFPREKAQSIDGKFSASFFNGLGMNGNKMFPRKHRAHSIKSDSRKQNS